MKKFCVDLGNHATKKINYERKKGCHWYLRRITHTRIEQSATSAKRGFMISWWLQWIYDNEFDARKVHSNASGLHGVEDSYYYDHDDDSDDEEFDTRMFHADDAGFVELMIIMMINLMVWNFMVLKILKEPVIIAITGINAAGLQIVSTS